MYVQWYLQDILPQLQDGTKHVLSYGDTLQLEGVYPSGVVVPVGLSASIEESKANPLLLPSGTTGGSAITGPQRVALNPSWNPFIFGWWGLCAICVQASSTLQTKTPLSMQARFLNK